MSFLVQVELIELSFLYKSLLHRYLNGVISVHDQVLHYAWRFFKDGSLCFNPGEHKWVLEVLLRMLLSGLRCRAGPAMPCFRLSHRGLHRCLALIKEGLHTLVIPTHWAFVAGWQLSRAHWSMHWLLIS